jgi:hypothetical protein
MVAQYGENCITQRKVYKWVERVHSARTGIVDEDHSGHLTTSQMANGVKRVNVLVEEDRLLSIVHEDLEYKNLCKVGAKSAHMDTRENVRSICAAIS